MRYKHVCVLRNKTDGFRERREGEYIHVLSRKMTEETDRCITHHFCVHCVWCGATLVGLMLASDYYVLPLAAAAGKRHRGQSNDPPRHP